MRSRALPLLLSVPLLIVACSDEADDDPGELSSSSGAQQTSSSGATDEPSSSSSGELGLSSSSSSGESPGSSSSGAASSSGTVPSGEPAEVAGVLAAHNLARSRVSPAASPPIEDLEWSEPAATAARNWAAQCKFQHSSGSGFGENLFAGTGSYDGAAVVANWESEKSNYNYAENRCSGVCGHYTQVVWASTRGLGCAKQKCTTGSPFGNGAWELWVCNYAPPGNFGGQRPY